LIVTLAAACAAAAAACGDVVRQGTGPVSLVIDSMAATAGGDGTSGSFLLSDVVDDDGGAFNDTGTATVRLLHKNPLLTPSAINAVTIQRYTVTYRRSDGRNTPGVDVPFPLEGAITATITGSGTLGFELVRHTQKREMPLAAFSLGGNRALLSVIADVTFFGRDQAGNEVSSTGSIGITFGNFAGA
jgi:hypothetical protein